jgi:hypothetical protein
MTDELSRAIERAIEAVAAAIALERATRRVDWFMRAARTSPGVVVDVRSVVAARAAADVAATTYRTALAALHVDDRNALHGASLSALEATLARLTARQTRLTADRVGR